MAYSREQIVDAINRAKADNNESAVQELSALLSKAETPAQPAQAPSAPSIAQQAAAAGYPIAYPAGISTAPTQEQARDIGISAMRYGAPIAVGLATGGVGLAPALYMAGTALASESIAQFLEREAGQRKEMDPRRMAAAPAFAAAPILRFTQPVASVSPGVASFLASAASSAVAGEAGRAIEAGQMFPKSEGKIDAAMRFTTPFLSGAAARLGSNIEQSISSAERISKIRGGAGLFNPDGTIANVLLSEANPSLVNVEKRNIANFNPAAIDRLVRTDDNIPQVAMSIVQQAPESTPIAEELIKNMQLSQLRDQSVAAEKAAAVAKDAATRARQTYSADAQRLMAQAEEAVREKMRAKVAFDRGLGQTLGPKLPSLFSFDPATVALEIKKVADDATDAIKLARGGLYDATGIQINDPVVGLDEVLSNASKASKSGKLLEGKEANSQFMEAISSAFGEKTELSREQFLEFKNMYAKRLAGGSSDPKVISAAEKKAGEQYQVLKDAANDYILRKYGTDVHAQWKAANEAYAQSVASLDSDVVSLLSNNRFEDFFNQVKSGGKNSQAWRQLNQYADFLSGISQKAVATRQVNPADLAVADSFRQHVYAAMMKGMLESSLVDGARKASKISGNDAIDPQKFVRNIAELETRGEFPVKEVFGADANDFRRLARFVDKKLDGRINQKELTDWLSMLPKEGVNVATERLGYRKAVQKALLETDLKRRNAALRAAELEAGSLRNNANVLAAEYNAAASDPLTRFFADTNFRIDPNDYANNSKLAQRIVQDVDPIVVKKFVASAAASGKSALVDGLGKIAAADAIRRFVPTQYEGMEKLRLRDITDFFYSPDDKLRKQRENLIALVGNDRYDVIKKEVVDPISDIIRGREAVQGRQPNVFNDVRALATIYGGAQGNITGGAMLAQGGNNILKAADKRYYNLLAQVYLNPKFSRDLQAVGYDLARFAQISPVYSAQVNSALAKDAEAMQGQPTP